MKERHIYCVMWLRQLHQGDFAKTYYHRYTEFNCWPDNYRRNSYYWGKSFAFLDGPNKDVESNPHIWLSDIEKIVGENYELLWIYEEVPWQSPIHDCWLFEIPGEDFVSA